MVRVAKMKVDVTPEILRKFFERERLFGPGGGDVEGVGSFDRISRSRAADKGSESFTISSRLIGVSRSTTT
jgi:hypothetical protein